MAAEVGEVLYQAEQNPNPKAKVIYKTKEEDDALANSKMDTFQQQALEIREPGPDFDPTAQPRDGEEFLMHMLYERKKCPAVMVKEPSKVVNNNAAVELSENFMDNEDPLKSIPYPGMPPTKEWKEYQLADFEATRKKVLLLRDELHRQKYDQTLEPPLTTDVLAWRKFCKENPPYLKIILRFGQRTLEQLLEFICEWLREGAAEEKENVEKMAADDANDDNDADATPSTSTANAASQCDSVNALAADEAHKLSDLTEADSWLGTWLYATLTCLHIPIEPVVHSTLRDIARVCIQLRGRIPQTLAGKAVPYNLFILLVAKGFGQMDFAEYV